MILQATKIKSTDVRVGQMRSETEIYIGNPAKNAGVETDVVFGDI
jgi:hypothetical protein